MAAIYIHVPFCRQRCSYCDFYFVTSSRDVERYVSAVQSEVLLRKTELLDTETIETIYFGGGTPSRLSTKQLAEILGTVEASYSVSQSPEVTIEANPDDVTPVMLDELRGLGITRLSLGIQSLHGSDLEFMNRSHDAQQGRRAVQDALSAGFESVSLDLIFGLPDMTDADWKTNLAYAISSGAHHVSLYGLTVEPNTVLGKWVRSGAVVPTTDERMESQFRLAHDLMTEAGFEHYEVSNFARKGHRSRHNSSYWNHTDYLGFGPSAHSFTRHRIPRRSENARSLRRYLESIESDHLPIDSDDTLDNERLMQEFVFLGLRTSDGIDVATLSSTYGYRLTSEGERHLTVLEEEGVLQRDGTVVRLTLNGFLVADAVNATLLTNPCFEQISGHSGL